MNKKYIYICILLIILIGLLCFIIFSNTDNNNLNTDNNSTLNLGNTTAVLTNELTTDTEIFSNRDKESDYTDSDYTNITLGDNIISSNNNVNINNNTVTISDEGTYVFTGNLSDGQIIIEAEKTDKIQLVLNNVNISSSSSSPIYIKQADKVFITLDTNSTNTLATLGEYVTIDENNIDSVIFSKEDLTLNGTGKLIINSNYGHGIVSKDDLIITGGTYDIDVTGEGMSGKDCVKIADGTFNITSTDKGIKSVNDDDTTLGYIYIEGGNFTVTSEDDTLHSNLDIYIKAGTFNLSSKDDGIHADSTLLIDNGNINILESYEGLEAQNIEINGGNINITSSDDGINAAGGNDSSGTTNGFGKMDKGGFDTVEDAYIKITGGKIYVNAEGDGLDSNGDLYISGGETIVYGPTNNGNGALDYNGNASITGGTCIALGTSGMAQNFGNNSTQGSILLNLNSTQQKGSEISLLDSDNNVLATVSAEKNYNSILISTPDIKENEMYTIKYGSNSETITMSSLIYGNGGMQGGGMKGGMNGDMPPIN